MTSRRPRSAEPRGRSPWGARAAALALFAAFALLVVNDLRASGAVTLAAIALVLLVGLPLNGLSVRAALRDVDRLESRTPRPLLYGITAALWAAIALLGVLAAAASDGFIDLAPLAPPASAVTWGAVAGALGPPALIALWGADLRRNRRKRARLRKLYDEGLRLIAPRSRAELLWFRSASTVSSAGEELAYRLVLLQLLAAFVGPVAAAVISSAAFAFGHTYQGLRAAMMTGGFGLVAAALTLATDSLWPALVLHIAWNQAAARLLWAVYRPRRA